MSLRLFASALVVSSFSIGSAQAQDASADGQRLFQQRCGTCHSVQPGQTRVGPNLSGVFGRKAGTVEGARYSDALKNAGIVWSDETLNAYLDDPRKLVPNTTMTISLRDQTQRGAIVAYLRGLSSQTPAAQ
ncbi:c-type cytochrome [Flaviflagellibacter deserti]|jgi:cytochrome c|uniref:C-type cytochrome n=1 Tax=Flaviflagellibacter deserti TaxID=2267266 RepID=A0ABV9Z9M4_9HYPH